MKRYEKIQQVRNELFGDNKNGMATVTFVDMDTRFDIDPTVIEKKLEMLKENVRLFDLFTEYEYQLEKIDVFINYVWDGDYGDSFTIIEKNDELRVELVTLRIDTETYTEKGFILDEMTAQRRMIEVLENRLNLLNEEVD